MVYRVHQIGQKQRKNDFETIRKTKVLRIVRHKFDKTVLALYQNGQAGSIETQCIRDFCMTVFPIGKRQTRHYSTC